MTYRDPREAEDEMIVATLVRGARNTHERNGGDWDDTIRTLLASLPVWGWSLQHYWGTFNAVEELAKWKYNQAKPRERLLGRPLSWDGLSGPSKTRYAAQALLDLVRAYADDEENTNDVQT